MKKEKKTPLPLLPPEVGEDEIEVSDEDLEFVKENREYARFLTRLDSESITRHVLRLDGKREDALESFYEKRMKNKSLSEQTDEIGIQVDPVDALPVKTLKGELHYRTACEFRKSEKISEEDAAAIDDKGKESVKNVLKLTKAERREQLKKSKKEAKKQPKEDKQIDVVQGDRKSEVLASVKEDLSAEEVFMRKKSKLAEVGMSLLAAPEKNIASLKELLQICSDEDHNIAKLGLLSLSAVFRDIMPGYRIRLPTEKEMEMKVSKEVQKMRDYESMLLQSYQAYLQKLIALGKVPSFSHLVVRCICTLLDAAPHFNFRESLLAEVIKNTSSTDDIIRELCCATLKSLFINEGKHGGEATVEAAQLIANHVKNNGCQLHPACIEVFLSLSFDEDLSRPASLKEGDKFKHKKKRWKQNAPGANPVQANEKKRSRQELAAKTSEEVNADFKAASFVPDQEERRRMQTDTLSAVFETYFRILKSSLEPNISWSKSNAKSLFGGFGARPLVVPCLTGLGKFSHLISVDFMGDLLNSLKKLASSESFTITERLQCCIVAFKVMKSNLDALNIDLQEFFLQLYNLLLDYRPDRDNRGEVLAEALKIMLCEGKQHDMQRAAAFIKRLATFSLCFGSAEAMTALVTVKHLLQKNIKCQNLLENDGGGGSLTSSVAKYQPDASDPNLSGALSSVLWELSLLSRQYHPVVSSMALGIASMSTAPNQFYVSAVSPQQAFANFSIERESFDLPTNLMASIRKRKRGSGSSVANLPKSFDQDNLEDEEVRKRFCEHFMVLRDITENERFREELNVTLSSISMYRKYRRQKKRKLGSNAQ